MFGQAEISGVNTLVVVQASKTFPIGFPVMTGADDIDPIQFEDIVVASTEMTTGAALAVWSKAAKISFKLGIIPNCPDDALLSQLLEANRPQFGKRIANDVIKIIITYPSGLVVILSNGRIISGPSAPSATSAGRLKSNTYSFEFGSQAKTGNITGLPII
jgi:hypothetical protein